jgi:hypothetical protein
MTASEWVRSNLPTKGDPDDELPGNNDEVIIRQGKNLDPGDPDGTLTETVMTVSAFVVVYKDVIDSYIEGAVGKATFLENAKARARDPSNAATQINSRDPVSTDIRDWSNAEGYPHHSDAWDRWDAEGRL